LLSLKQMLKKAKEVLSKLDNERLAIAIVSIIALALLFPLLVIAPGLLEAEWFLNILTVLAEYGSFIAGAAYIGRLCNLFTATSCEINKKEKTKVTTFLNKEVVMGRQILIREKELTPIGMLLGIMLAVVCIVLHVTVPFLSIFSWFAYILFILGYGCALAGLFNRLGSSMDGTRLPQEKTAILFGAGLGLVFAVSLIVVLALTGSLPLVAVAGISKVFFDLFVLHKTLFTLTFILSLTSVSTSFFDYFAKAYCFLKYRLGSQDKALNERIESRYHEYRGAFLGLGVGILLALGIIVGLLVTGGLASAPLVVAATLCITVITCGSATSALFSRIGRVIDGLKRPSVYPATVENKRTDEKPTLDVNENDLSKERERVIEISPKSQSTENTISCESDGTRINEGEVEIRSLTGLIMAKTGANTVNSTAKQNPELTAYSAPAMASHLGKTSTNSFNEQTPIVYSSSPRQSSAKFFQLNREEIQAVCLLQAESSRRCSHMFGITCGELYINKPKSASFGWVKALK
jgi:hypothetical protein